MSDVDRLSRPVQKWIFKQGWSSLRDIQEQSIAPILSKETDVIISASTAAGKTEAAFLPACSIEGGDGNGFSVLYLSPLKALINDQFRRLESLSDDIGTIITPWHGDAPQSLKNRAKMAPKGILLITPESLESMLMLRHGWAREAFNSLDCIIIDEFHAFIGTERGRQLISLLTRLEYLIDPGGAPIPRVALSATLGDMSDVMTALRPARNFPCKLIKGEENHSELKFQLKGYIDTPTDVTKDSTEYLAEKLPADYQITEDLFESMRGSSNLVFANSRRRSEIFAVLLSDMCAEAHLPNEFYPHHGSLSKELRENLERRLQQDKLPTTAICTMTLELGIDIGKVRTVAQVGPPNSTSSLRQRLGRSGRRDEPSRLQMHISENELNDKSPLGDVLRLQLFQATAITHLLLGEKWYEPPESGQKHFSTLLHQVLSVISEWGGVRADQLWLLLCFKGPFTNVLASEFRELLRSMKSHELIDQLQSGEITLGIAGERLSNHYSFYAVFSTPEEYRIIMGSKTIGTLPIESEIAPGQSIIFGGRRMRIESIDSEGKAIYVKRSKSGQPPKFGGGGILLDRHIRQTMKTLFRTKEHRIATANSKITFLDETARKLFAQGADVFERLALETKQVISFSGGTYIISWEGDKTINTLMALFMRKGIIVQSFGGIIEVSGLSVPDTMEQLHSFARSPMPTNTELAEAVTLKHLSKHDGYLSDMLLNINYGAYAYDTEACASWLSKFDSAN